MDDPNPVELPPNPPLPEEVLLGANGAAEALRPNPPDADEDPKPEGAGAGVEDPNPVAGAGAGELNPDEGAAGPNP